MQSGKFSVITPIIVIAVILFIIKLFTPVIFIDRICSRKLTCLNNLKQCAQALKMYSDDYEGKLPSSYFVNRSKSWNRSDFLTFATKCGKFPPDGKSRLMTWSQILYYNMKNKEVMFCPSDASEKSDPDVQTSYWYKLANDKAWYGVGCPKPRQLMNDYGYESDQIAFYERWPWHFGGERGLKRGEYTNAVFMDTHVETITISHATSGDPINCAANSDGEPMYYNCAVNRKTGYVKTQPGPAKLTDPTYCYDSL